MYLQQVKNLGQVIKDSVGKKTTKVNSYDENLILINIIVASKVDMSVVKDAMYGGVATWDREKNTFNIHKSGM